MVDNDVYYLLLALMNPSQKPGFKGGGWYRCCFSSPFDRFSFAPAASTFTQLKTIVRHLRCGQPPAVGQRLAALTKTWIRDGMLMNMI
jgi:hypothetical protein